MRNIDGIIDEILIGGTDDWVGIWEIARIVEIDGEVTDNEDVLSLSLNVIRKLLTDGFMEVGSVTKKDGFQAWELPSHEALARIEREWRALGKPPSLGEICWFRNTPKGHLRGNSALSRLGDGEGSAD